MPIWQAIETYRGRSRKLTDYTAINPQFLARMESKNRVQASNWDLSYRPWANGRKMRIAVLNRLDNGEYALTPNAMGFEQRDPTSDLRLLEFCLAIPDHQYLSKGQTRWLLHRLMADVLPSEILHAQTKGLQAADWHENVGENLLAMNTKIQHMKEHSGVASYLDLDALSKSINKWPQSGWGEANQNQMYRLKLLRGMAAGTFIRYIDDSNV